MNKKKFDIWGRTLELDIVYDCYCGEEILESQKKAFDMFCENAVILFNKAYVSPIFQKRCVKNGGIGRYLYKDETLLANYYNGSNSTVYGKYLVNIQRYTKKKLHPDTYSESEIAEMSRQSLQNVADRLFSEYGITPDLVKDNLIRIYRDGCGRSDCCSELAQSNPLMTNVVNLYRSYNYDSNIFY